VIATVDDGPFELAESPLWDARTQSLLWVDIVAGAIFRHRPETKSTTRTDVGEQVGCIALTSEPAIVIAALRSGWHWVDLETGDLRLIATPEHAHARCRFNDGAVDPAGRFWTGSLEDPEVDPVGRLYCLEAELTFKTMDSGFVCSNGIDWSPDMQCMYFVDSHRNAIYRYTYDVTTGEIGARELFVDTRSLPGVPDGLEVDAGGTLWCAFWDGASVCAFNSAGELVDTVPLPVPRPTSITFGGSDLTTMYVTTASRGLTAQQRSKWPSSGSVLEIKTTNSGRPANFFAGTPGRTP
jgi:sugar lactone lactonase YvrE